MHYYHGWHFWGMHWGWWLFWGVFLVWFFFMPHKIPGQRKKEDTALNILRKKLANGEIDEEEFKRKKKLLKEK